MGEMELLIVDDEENMCHMLKAMVERHGYAVDTANDGESALELIKNKQFEFILCDVKMPTMDGMMFLAKGANYLRNSTVIMMSAYGTVDLALEAMKAGAYDFISKPFKSDEVLLALKKAEEREQLKKENRRLKDEIADIKEDEGLRGLVAKSAGMRKIFSLVRKVAVYDTTVLITGESGTGKELVARGIHEISPRRNKALVAVNCGSIPENLLESELFGYVKGAFTGAAKNKRGLFEEAEGATLFLDEIGELPLAMQVKLLRVLQEQEIRPVGALHSKNVNVRVVAATARDLEEQVRNGAFREDLFYRLNVMHIPIPSLRERKEDIPLLCNHFVKKMNSKFNTKIKSISPRAMLAIDDHPWPGNVRELENVIQRGIVLTETDVVDADHLPQYITNSVSIQDDSAEMVDKLSLKVAQKKLEADMIARAMLFYQGNKSKAAQALEISYPSMLNKLKKYNIL